VPDIDFTKVTDGATLYIPGSAIRNFSENMATLPGRVILVSGDCDETIPDAVLPGDAFKSFIESDKIIHWYSQNCTGVHPKLTPIPIGLDYHSDKTKSPVEQEAEFTAIKNASKPFWERTMQLYSNFHFNKQKDRQYTYDRDDAIAQIPADLIFYEPTYIPKINTYTNQSKYAFVASPHGNGLDCHRTWEALCLGCIPVVKTSGIDSLFADLPVLIVKNWSDITKQLLESTIAEFKDKKFNYDRITLKYWMDRINSGGAQSGGKRPVSPPYIIAKNVKRGGNGNSIFVTVVGGLGNQLYMYAAGIVAKNKLKMPLYLLPGPNPHTKEDYRVTLFKQGTPVDPSEMKPRTNSANKVLTQITAGTPHMGFVNTNIVANGTKNVLLPTSFYQNYKSILPAVPLIRTDFSNIFQEKYPELKGKIDSASTAFMHVRKGDYKEHSLPAEYYFRALDKMNGNGAIKNIFVISDDVPWCKEQKFETKTGKPLNWIDDPLKQKDELYTLYIMMLCLGGAIISASTFSSWGAILGPDQNPESMIIYPDIWITGPSQPIEFPPRWIVVNKY